MNKKLQALRKYLEKTDQLVLAFSGGVDSTFLAAYAHEVLKDKLTTVTIATPYIPKWEIREAVNFVKERGINHRIIELETPENITHNPENRCYLCKTKLFNRILDYARKQGVKYVADGSNADDVKDYRPGMKALKELEILSPLLENGITKAEVRQFSHEMGLPTWDRPAYACLLTRLPYHTTVKNDVLEKIEAAEVFLTNRGLVGCRVRVHDQLARIEINPLHFQKIVEEEFRSSISQYLKQIGFAYVTFDATGYRVGSFNETIKGKGGTGEK